MLDLAVFGLCCLCSVSESCVTRWRDAAGDYRPCYYASYSDFLARRPVTCGEEFAIVEGQVVDRRKPPSAMM